MLIVFQVLSHMEFQVQLKELRELIQLVLVVLVPYELRHLVPCVLED